MPGLGKRIIGPTPRPEPSQGRDTLILLAIALTYLAFLLLFKGIEPDTAFDTVSKRFGVSEEALRKASKGSLWKQR